MARTPEVIASFGESVLAAQLGYGHAGFCFTQEADDLLFCESFLHVQLLVMVDWTLKSRATQDGVDVAASLVRTNGQKGEGTGCRVALFRYPEDVAVDQKEPNTKPPSSGRRGHRGGNR